MRFLAFLALGFVIALAVAPAFAADPTVQIPIGDWLVTALNAAAPTLIEWTASFILLLLAWAGRRLPSALTDWIRQEHVEKLAQAAIGYAITATEGAVRGRTLPINVGDAVLQTAIERFLDVAPSTSARLGGYPGVAGVIAARLDIEPGSTLYIPPDGVASIDPAT